eukprot:CAMPEP_0185845722 /NCGR_PEP_ID=MMETSP1354-20130828/1608_1 /TAXON_ID=708628 /ORGANISM="Erythrolobus madagascarensis, Strain CCMP3276" /LENGTH=228 /DNA_ID=CAMNT_0028545751 /DNA_START=1247 /DNA_END=1933 /DNA_ORIENTATION=+
MELLRLRVPGRLGLLAQQTQRVSGAHEGSLEAGGAHMEETSDGDSGASFGTDGDCHHDQERDLQADKQLQVVLKFTEEALCRDLLDIRACSGGFPQAHLSAANTTAASRACFFLPRSAGSSVANRMTPENSASYRGLSSASRSSFAKCFELFDPPESNRNSSHLRISSSCEVTATGDVQTNDSNSSPSQQLLRFTTDRTLSLSFSQDPPEQIHIHQLAPLDPNSQEQA